MLHFAIDSTGTLVLNGVIELNGFGENQMTMSPSEIAAREFALNLTAVDRVLGQWAYEKAKAGYTVDEIKGLLHAAIEKSGRK